MDRPNASWIFAIAIVLACGGDASTPQDVVSPTVALTSDALSRMVGQPITLSWSSTDATHCTASGSWSGNKNTSGQETIQTATSQPGPIDFVLTCAGAGGSVTATASALLSTELMNQVQSIVAIANDDSLYSGTATTGALPTDGSGAPLTVTASVDAVKAGSAFINVLTTQQPVSLLVTVNDLTGVPSHYTIDLTHSSSIDSADEAGNLVYSDPRAHVSIAVSDAARSGMAQRSADTFSYDMLVTFTDHIVAEELTLSVVALYAAPGINSIHSMQSGPASRSPPADSRVTFNGAAVPSRSLQVTLSWNADVDLDLHVKTPSGTEIGYRNRSGGGGTLDVDSFPACTPPAGHTEHVSWGNNTPAPHVYTIRPNYYDNCDVTTPVRYTVTVSKGLVTQSYVGTFAPSEANKDAGTDPAKLVYTAILDDSGTDAGLMSRLLLAEVKNPGFNNYDAGQATTGMRAIASIVRNRGRSPSTFLASDSSTRSIITAPGQFDGFTGGVSSDIELRTARVTTPARSLDKFKTFWEGMFEIAEGRSVTDPFAAITKIGNEDVEAGTWGVRTNGSRPPGPNFVLEPGGANISGQDFYTIKKGVIRP